MTSAAATPMTGTSASRAQSARRARRQLTISLDLRNTWQVLAGALLLPLGIAFILLAWSGAAHGRVDQQQIPYLVSGGIGGLAVVIIGCFFYFAHWLYRLYDQADLQHEEAMREQRELMSQLIEAVAANRYSSSNGSAPRASTPRRAEPGVAERSFVATASGTNFHVPGCSMVANRTGGLRTVSEREAAGMKPCRICDPLVSAEPGSHS